MIEIFLQSLVSLIALTVLVLGVSARNRLVGLRRRAQHCYHSVDAVLRRRHREIPALIEASRPWPVAARCPLERLARLRAGIESSSSRSELGARVRLENELTAVFDHLLATLDKAPKVRRPKAIAALRERLAELERQVAEDRAAFNECAMLFNTATTGFPGGLVTRVIGYEPLQLLTNGADAARGATSLQWS